METGRQDEDLEPGRGESLEGSGGGRMRQEGAPAGFLEIRAGNVQVWVREGFSFLFDRSGNLRAERPSCTVNRDTPYRGRAEIQRISLGGRGRPCGLVRHYRRGGFLERLLRDRYLGRKRFFRELLVTEGARLRGIPTVDVLALRTDRVGLGFYRADLVTREIERAQDLDAVLKNNPGTGGPSLGMGWKSGAVSCVAGLVREMHDAGLFHADLNLKNILLREEGNGLKSFVIDLDKAKWISSLGKRHRMKNLLRLYRSLEKLGFAGGQVTVRDVARFVRVYCRGDRELAEACRKRMRRVPLSLRIHRFFWRLSRARA
jgi:tRNA A-37 threonylcarbamoyl transferase component Bud32